MKIRKIFSTALLIFGAISTLIIFSSNAYADLGSGIGEFYIWFLIIASLQIVLLITWFIVHILSKKSSIAILITRTFIDLATIIISSISIWFFSTTALGIPLGSGLWEAIFNSLTCFNYYKLSILVILILFILYFMNQWIISLSKSNRIVIHFFQCIFVILTILIIFSPTFAGPVTRWFVNPDSLIRYDEPFSTLNNAKLCAECYGFDKKIISFYDFEMKLYESSEYEVLKPIEKPAAPPITVPVTNTPSAPQPIDQKTQNLSTQTENDYDVNDYLILQDIGDYKLRTYRNISFTENKRINNNYILKIGVEPFEGGHYIPDHKDIAYITEYSRERIKRQPSDDSRSKRLRFICNCGDVDINIVRHMGGESDKWLQHELVEEFIRGEDGKEKILTTDINGNKVFTMTKCGFALQDVTYGWLHNNVIIKIKCDREIGYKTTPTEIISAYLKKFPSTIQPVDIKKWKRDRTEYELWLGKKWMKQIKNAEPLDDKILTIALKHIFLYLNFREEEYGKKAIDDKKKLWKLYLAKDLPQINKFVADNEKWLAQEVKK